MSTEEFKVNGDEVLKTIKKIIAAGNARRIIIKNEAGDSLPLDFERRLTI